MQSWLPPLRRPLPPGPGRGDSFCEADSSAGGAGYEAPFLVVPQAHHHPAGHLRGRAAEVRWSGCAAEEARSGGGVPPVEDLIGPEGEAVRRRRADDLEKQRQGSAQRTPEGWRMPNREQ